jgi:hypothetical protein
MATKTATILASVILAAASGCATHHTVVIDTNDDIVRLTKPVKASVATYDRTTSKWVDAGKAELPAGMYVGPGKK